MKTKKRKKEDSAKEFEEELKEKDKTNYVLRLFVTGTTPQSVKAIENIKYICEENLRNRYELEVIDIYKNPQSAKTEQIIVAPTLIKKLPLPLRRIIGDLSNTEKVIVGLDLKSSRK